MFHQHYDGRKEIRCYKGESDNAKLRAKGVDVYHCTVWGVSGKPEILSATPDGVCHSVEVRTEHSARKWARIVDASALFVRTN
jgi:hypothetical protein